MQDDISKKENVNVIKNDLLKECIYINYFIFDFNYEIITPILKDIQIMAQLIKLKEHHQISDIIFIKGNNSYTNKARFYFRYKNMLDFYVKVLDVIETDYFTKLCYFIYKTKPKSIEFRVNFLIFFQNENKTDFHFEIILSENRTLSKKILKMINEELILNFSFLIQSLKADKLNSFLFFSSIIKNEFFVLTKIIQNTKLIEYIIKGKLFKIEKYQKEKSSIDKMNKIDNDKEGTFLKEKEEFKVSLLKFINDDLNSKLDSISFKILLIKITEDKMLIQIKVLSNGEEIENNNTIFNIITISIRKLTGNSCSMFIKYIWDFSLNVNIINYIKGIIKKCLNNIDKLCKRSKQY